MKKYSICLIMSVFFCLLLSGCGDTREDYEKAGHMNEVTVTGGLTKIVTKPATPTPTAEPVLPYCVCLDPGHGGRWEGAIYHKKNEKDIVLQLCQEIRSYLNEHYPDIEVLLTREEDRTFSDDLGTDLRKRVEFAKDNGAQILVSIHLNASDKHNMRGSMVCISKQPNIHDISITLANTLLKRTESLGLRNRGYEWKNSNDTFDEKGEPVDYYAICRHGASLNIPSIILESLFMDNDDDYAFISSDEAMKKLAAAEAEGIAEFLYKNMEKRE